MKAKEYFEKYDKRFTELDLNFTSDDSLKIVQDLVVEFSEEQSKIANNRHIHTNKAAESLINEFNNKWNTVCNLFEKKYGVSPVKYNGWTIIMKEVLDREVSNNG